MTGCEQNPCGVSRIGLVDALRAQIARTPGAMAVHCGGDRISYAEFGARTDRLATALHAQGLGKGGYVAIAFERSIDMLVALWGVIKSGAAYIPVDPAYPDERIAHMAASARWAALIAPRTLGGRFNAIHGAGPVLPLDDLNADGPLPPIPEPHDPLYAIFTSGSTGQPKAAIVFHAGFSNLVEWYIDTFKLNAECRDLVLSSLSFDLTQKNLIAPLLVGGSVILQPPGPYDIPAILDQIGRHRVTVLNTTPSAFYPLVDATAARGFAPLASLRVAVLGGEPISIPRLRAWLEAPGTQACVANTYGPTECTDICAWHRLDRTNLARWPYVPLGREIPQTAVALLDDDLQPVAPGEQGELCIGGIGVGGGYLHDPDRTAARFIPNPHPQLLAGDRMYRSGDLARRDAEGVLEFRGRIDHQVKVRGFRIELGEIEHALAAHPSVREAVVTARGAGAEDAQLTAWVAAREGKPTDVDLRAYLAARLPDYMVPASVNWMDRFPLTPNGKIDRLALHARAPAVASPPSARYAAEGWEARVLSLWSSVLGRPVDDPTVNFFDLGGTSLQLAIVHARLREMLGRDIPITELFQYTTARALARHIEGAGESNNRYSPLERARRQRAIFTAFSRVAS